MTDPPQSDVPGLDTPAAASAVRITSRRVPPQVLPLGVRRGGDRGPERRCVPLGTVDGGVVAEVDPAGAVQVAGATWLLDWWIGAADRWHHPSMEVAVRQAAIAGSPAVQTSVRVPDGDVVQRLAGAVVHEGGERLDAVVVELENRSPVPVALALVLRPWHLDRPGSLGTVEVDGLVVRVDGRPALLLARPPARMVHGSDGSVARRLADGADGPVEARVTGNGALEAALVFPLAHSATMRVAVPTAVPPAASRRRRERRSRSPRPPRAVGPERGAAVPTVDSVVAGWAAHTRDDLSVDLPVQAWSALVGWSGSVLRLCGPREVTRALDRDTPPAAGPDSGTRLLAVATALAALPVPELHDAVAAALCAARRRGGGVRVADGSDATVALLVAGSATLRGARGRLRSDELHGPMAGALSHVARHRERVVAATGARRLAVALSSSAAALAATGQLVLAREALDLAGGLLDGPAVAMSDERPAPEGGPRSTFGGARVVRDQLAAGTEEAIDALSAHLAGRGETGVGDAEDDEGRSCGRYGLDAAELAETRSALVEVLVCDDPRGPLFLPSWSPAWAGRPLEARRVPTAWGAVSMAVRWHGSRPVLLWEIAAAAEFAGTVLPEVRAPGLAPGWRAGGWSGEVLLDEPAVR